jgi:hypothetical protein
VVDRFSDERAIGIKTVKPNVFTLELLLDGNVVAEFAIVFINIRIILEVILKPATATPK